jgi:hypothetical protein
MWSDRGNGDTHHLSMPLRSGLLASTSLRLAGGYPSDDALRTPMPRSRPQHAVRGACAPVLLATLEVEERDCLSR